MASQSKDESYLTKVNGVDLQPVAADHDVAIETVNEKSTVDDYAHMARLGKKQQFDRNFQLLSITAFSVVAMGGWIFVPNNAFWGLVDGNTGGTITMYLINFAAFSSINFSLAEMASMAPTAGGQYHWASEFAPKALQKPLSYTAGWLSALAWCCGVTSGVFITGNLIQAVIVELHPNKYTSEAWKGYLFVLAIAVIAGLINTFLSRALPRLEGIAFVLFVAGFVSIIVVIWVLSAGDELTTDEVFDTFTNEGGWSSLGLAMMAGQILMVWTLTGSDAIAHMAEETRSASSVIPRAMMWSYFINGLMVFLILITYCFALTDFSAAEDSATGYPFVEVFAHATGSPSGGAGLTCVLIVLTVLSVVNYMAASSRQVFAFARDKGLPGYNWIAKVDARTNCPVPAVFFVFMFSILVSLISLGSSVAFNAITSLQLLALVFTYMLTISCLAWRRVYGEPLPRGSWSLGKFGMPVNLFAIAYSLYLIIFICFPTEVPVTLSTFNWAPVMFGGVVILALVYYIVHGRFVYDGPVKYIGSAY